MKPDSSSNLVFLENQAQVVWVKQSMALAAGTKLIAMTAEALQMLEECGLPHEAIAAYDDPPQLRLVEEQINRDTFALALEIETFIGQRYSEARFDGPGFLSGQGWYLQYSLIMVATRAFLMRQAIQACSPEVVTVFEGSIDPWFAGCGYRRDPWLEVVAGLSQEYGFCYQPISDPSLTPTPYLQQPTLAARLRFLMARAPRALRRRLTLWLRRKQSRPDLAGLRLLILDDDGYDWRPVLDTLRNIAGVELRYLTGAPFDGNTANHAYYAYTPQLKTMGAGGSYPLTVNSPAPVEEEAQRLAELFEAWQAERPTQPELRLLGLNFFPALKPYLQTAVQLGPALARHSDSIVAQALDIAKPHAVCCFAISYLSSKRLAYQCQQRGVPVICYQHGAQYGWRDSAKDEQIDPAYADYFLTYGVKIQPRANLAFPVRAKYVPVGSARIEAMRHQASPMTATLKQDQIINVLWIASFPTRNTAGVISGDSEDTARYLLQKRCLQQLGQANHLRVTYRTYRSLEHLEGTTRWLNNAHLPSIRTDIARRLEELIRASDVVISDNTTGTTWAEVIGLRKPFILFCDPDIAHLSPHFVPDLEHGCYWCKSEEALLAAIHRLITDHETFLAELQQLDPAAFIRDHVLHREDGICVPRVISFLNDVCRQRQPIDEWQSLAL